LPVFHRESSGGRAVSEDAVMWWPLHEVDARREGLLECGHIGNQHKGLRHTAGLLWEWKGNAAAAAGVFGLALIRDVVDDCPLEWASEVLPRLVDTGSAICSAPSSPFVEPGIELWDRRYRRALPMSLLGGSMPQFITPKSPEHIGALAALLTTLVFSRWKLIHIVDDFSGRGAP